MSQESNGTTANSRQPQSIAQAGDELDAAERYERAALAEHDAARARLRAARSCYRRLARAERLSGDPPTLPTSESAARVAIKKAEQRSERDRHIYDCLVDLDQPDRHVIDAGITADLARYDLEELRDAYAERKVCPC